MQVSSGNAVHDAGINFSGKKEFALNFLKSQEETGVIEPELHSMLLCWFSFIFKDNKPSLFIAIYWEAPDYCGISDYYSVAEMKI